MAMGQMGCAWSSPICSTRFDRGLPFRKKPQPGAPGWGVVEGLPIRGRQPKVLTSERQIVNPYQYKPISRQHRDLCMATEDVGDNANVLRKMSGYFFDVIDDNVRVADAHGFEFSSGSREN